MAFESVAKRIAEQGRRRRMRGPSSSDTALFVAVRQYKGARDPRVMVRIREDIAKAAGLCENDRADLMFDPSDNTGLICASSAGWKITRAKTRGLSMFMQVPFVRGMCPDFGEHGYTPEEVEVKAEGILFTFPKELYRTGRNGTQLEAVK